MTRIFTMFRTLPSRWISLTTALIALLFLSVPVQAQELSFPVSLSVQGKKGQTLDMNFRNLPQGISYYHNNDVLIIRWSNQPLRNYYTQTDLKTVYRNLGQGEFSNAKFKPGQVRLKLAKTTRAASVELTNDGLRVQLMDEQIPFTIEKAEGVSEKVIKTKPGFVTNLEFEDEVKYITGGQFEYRFGPGQQRSSRQAGNFRLVFDNKQTNKTIISLQPLTDSARTNLTIYTEKKAYSLYIRVVDSGEKYQHRVVFPSANKRAVQSPVAYRATMLIKEYLRLKGIRGEETAITGDLTINRLQDRTVVNTNKLKVWTDYSIKHAGWELQGFVVENKTDASVRIDPRQWGQQIVAVSPKVILPQQTGMVMSIRSQEFR